MDGNGKRWGCVQYYFGIKNTWVYIDEPTADIEQIVPEGVYWADADRKAEEGLTESREENTAEGQEAESRQAESQKTEKSGRQDSREGSTDRIVPKLNRNLVTAAVVLVISVVAVTAALLVKLKGGRK